MITPSVYEITISYNFDTKPEYQTSISTSFSMCNFHCSTTYVKTKKRMSDKLKKFSNQLTHKKLNVFLRISLKNNFIQVLFIRTGIQSVTFMFCYNKMAKGV